MGDAQAEEETVQGAVPAGFDAPQQVVRGLLAHALQRSELLAGQSVDVSHVPDQAVSEDLLGDRRSEPFDVHGVPGGEMGDPRLYLRRAGLVPAAPRHLVALPLERRFTDRTDRGHLELRRRAHPLALVDRDDLGDDVPALLNDHGVADAQFFITDFVFVVEGGPADRRSGKEHRFELGDRGHHAGAADLEPDVREARHGPLRGELAGDGPAGAFHRGPEFAVQPDGVHLDDHAVDIVGQRRSPRFPFLAEIDNLANGGESPCFPVGWKSLAGQPAQPLEMAVQFGLFGECAGFVFETKRV